MMNHHVNIRDSALTEFFSGLNYAFHSQSISLKDQLPNLFNALHSCSFGIKEMPAERFIFANGDLTGLPLLLESLECPLKAVEEAGIFGSPWTAAALRRDEVRNASVLRWYLDPRGGHGCGDVLLVELLNHVRRHLRIDLPDRPSAFCILSVEECPDGINASRVDIQVDDPRFFVVLEVKIDAPEQRGQLERYCQVAAARACDMRPWAVVFLTPSGRPPTTGGVDSERVVPLKWSTIAASLRRVTQVRSSEIGATAAVPQFLANAFATHISNF